jgi:hypothetical protein
VKIIKTASGRKEIKMSKKEWQAIGKKAGWAYGGPQFSEGDRVVVYQTISAEASENDEDVGYGVISEVIPFYHVQGGSSTQPPEPDAEPIEYQYAVKFDPGTSKYFDDSEIWTEDMLEPA